MDSFITFTIGFLRQIHLFLPLYIEAMNKDQWYYQVCKEVAYVSAFAEILDAYNNMIGGEQRALRFYNVTFPKIKNKIWEISLTKKFDKLYSVGPRTNNTKSFNAISNCINKFMELDGMEKICNLIEFKW